MKTKILKLTTLCLLTIVFGCSSKKAIDINKKNVIADKTQELGKKASCVCTSGYFNSFCSPCISSNLLHGNDFARYKITWDACETQDPFADPKCKGSQSNFTSYARFCYSPPTAPNYNNCVLNMEIDVLPECIQCISTTFPYCVKLIASCTSTNGNDYQVTLDDTDPNTPAIIQYTIYQDETKIKLCCTKTNTATGQVNTYCCTGFMIYAP